MKNRIFLLAFALLGLLPAIADRSNTVTVAVFSVNDFHAGLLPDARQSVPGAAYVVQTLDSLKQVYPYHVTVSAGDNFGGSFFYNATRNKSLMPQAFKDMGIDISAVGNHEFDEGQKALADKWHDTELRPRSSNLTYVCANVRNSEGRIPSFAQPWAVVPVSVGGGKSIHVAFVGLLTSNTPWQARASNLRGLSFDGNYTAVLDSVSRLPGYDQVEKANIRLLLTHIGSHMEDGTPKWEDRDSMNLKTLDRNDIDAIFSAHSHTAVIGMSDSRRPYPILQGLWHGIYISMFKCEIDTTNGRLVGITPELVRVNPNAALSPKAARLQAQIEEQYHTTLFRGMPLSRKLTVSAQNFRHDRHKNDLQTKMGALVCESYAKAYRMAAHLPEEALVVGVSHFGSIRAGFSKGDVTVLNVGEALPFANALKAYRYTGRQLLELMNHGINVCKLGRIQTSGVNVKQDKRGRIRSLTLTLPSGKTVPLHPTSQLIVVADEYMTTGGDGYLPSQFPKEAEQTLPLPTSTDAFIAYLNTLDSIR
ncbi:bifunctional UDP-sugar hydrolase/5'-nucleotidase [Alloprevotella sp. OH1205_COT-284]|uniref:bifunctional metallophosphatase/5'-nucleotidase n=1 Tax=Alloprevotella sp. OH1205_COT-284 TaxID=2491043 RepID=UPI0013151F5E|nr:5'-nucleotidase C-terminal domain-containing protein [Alloprevotella sp. OH1205_COT-284]